MIDNHSCREIGSITEKESRADKNRTKFMIKNRFMKTAGKNKLGILWIILDPVAISLVYFFVLVVVRSQPSPESLFIGVTMFRVVQTSVMAGVNSIQDFSGGVSCERVRTKVLVESAFRYRIIEVMVQSSGVATILYFGLKINIESICAFMILTLFLGIILEGVFFNLAKIVRIIPDISNLVRYFMILMFFGSPALYPMSMTSGLHYKINEYNPFTYCVETVRYLAGLDSEIFNLSIEIGISLFSILVILTIRGYRSIDKLRWEVSSWS